VRALFLLMTFGGSLAQWSVVPALSVGGVTPDLPLIGWADVDIDAKDETVVTRRAMEARFGLLNT